MVEAASVVLFVFCRSDEDMTVPFVREVPDIRNGYIHASVLRTLDKGREAIVVSSDIDELPMIFAAYSFQIVDVLCLEGLIVLAGVTPGREFISEILFEFCDFSHCLKTSLIKFDDAYMLALQSVFAAEFLYRFTKGVEYIGMVGITAVSVAVRQEERSRRVVVIEDDFHSSSLP